MNWKYVAPTRLSSEAIKCYTSGFSEENYISVYPFGKLYHGCIDSQKVTVKTWEDVKLNFVEEGDDEIRLRVWFLRCNYNNLFTNFVLV